MKSNKKILAIAAIMAIALADEQITAAEIASAAKVANADMKEGWV